jgi:uncharacterized SAM-dependent methyltransferase
MGLDSGLSQRRGHYGQREHERPVKSSTDEIFEEQTSDETRSSDNDEIQQLISQGLRSSPRSLPSLLLWDSVGLNLYEKITESPDYYLTRVEADVIRNNVDAIVQSVGANGVVLELGSGYVL